jgi:hypothetical protein
MLAVVDEAERELAAGSIQEAAFNRFIVREHARIADLAVFRATDAAGNAIYGPAVQVASTSSLAHRDYFKVLKETPYAGLMISQPLIGGISGKWMMVLARRYSHPNGTFAGLVYSGVTIEHLTRSFSTIDLGRHGAIALVDSKGDLVARFPADSAIEKWVGRKIPSRQVNDLVQQDRATGTFTLTSSLDSVERTFSARKLGLPRSFFVFVGLATTDYLAEWRAEGWKLASFLAVFILITVVSTVLIHGKWRRHEGEVAKRKEAQDMLTLQKEALEATLARTKRLEGIISICMHCRKINNKKESWEQMEKYISDNSDARFSHGLCPECAKEHFPDLKT